MKVLFALLLLWFSVDAFSQALSVHSLQCNNLSAPLGVESPHPQLSWKIASPKRNVLQTAYRILVADNLSILQKGMGNSWDSKKVLSDASIGVNYEGKALEPTKTYYWKVLVWDNVNNVSMWSETSTWQMGLPNKWDWKNAKWIGYEVMPDSLKKTKINSEFVRTPLKDVLPLLRKSFLIKKTAKKATAFVSGLGHFELSVNGKKTGDHFLDAGWTNYDKEVLYVSFDVTGQLRTGNNAIGMMLGNGFYFSPIGRWLKLQTAYGYPKMICRIAVEYADGSVENIISDESWKAAPGPITFSSIYGGEDYNATVEQTGWNTASFNERTWKNAVVTDGPSTLTSQTATPLKIFDTFSVKKITQPKQGTWVYDLGQNASAIPRISVKGKSGDTVRLWPSELLDSAGFITTKPIGTPVYFTYILKGDVGSLKLPTTETWQPQFMYYGFRYVQIEGAVPDGKNNINHLPVVVSLQGLHTRNAADRVGEFSCSNDLFNKTDVLIDWAVRSNMASVLTDCPHREKLGWLEEAHLMGPSIRYNYNIGPLCRKVIRDMMASQTADGLIPSTAPEYAQFGGPFRDSPEWGSNAIIMPWYVYDWYGDKQILEEAYPMMQRYVAYLRYKSGDTLLMHGLGDWYDIGPKEPGPSQLTPRGLTPTAMFYYDLNIISKIAGLLNKQDDSIAYSNLATKIKTAYNKKFFNKAKMIYGSGSQTANAMSVYMNLVDPAYKDSVVANIVKELRGRNNNLTAGDIGYRYLLRVLDDAGRNDVIYDMNSNASVPGYGYQLAKGATALTESWQAYTNASNNHMMLGHIKEWFFSGLAGIRPGAGSVAFKEIEIKPQPVGDVTSAKGSYDSPYGIIKSEWNKNAASFDLHVVIPPNTRATIYLPATLGASITESGKTWKSDTKFEKGQANIRLGSGDYFFTVK